MTARRTAARVGRRALGAVAVALVLAAVALPWRPPTLCLLRGLTGVPCPFCGGTTAMVQLGSGRPLAALATSPLATLGAPLWVVWPAIRARAGGWGDRAGRSGRRTTAAVVAVLAASWVWQLQRYLA